VSRAAQRNRADGEERTFQKMSTYANHLGLYSGEIGLTGEQLANFPPGLQPPGLIGTAINLDYQLGCGAGNVAAAGFRSLVSNMLEHLRSSA
jgi:hypothetical protein